MTAPVAQVLRDAAELIERDRDAWIRPAAGLVLALGYVAEQIATREVWRLDYAVQEALSQHLGTTRIHMWENAPGRTVTEVLAALRACADEMDEDHTAAAVATGQSIGDEPWQHHDGEVIAMHDEQEASDG